ncbi:MAG: ABC transporter permease [Gemmatimonadota bacterium]|nr:ABC transporter permease [Gemmatimonadota bacterium]MDE2677197.1 ABC transporter permease [Gemmatimonadota bacterium]
MSNPSHAARFRADLLPVLGAATALLATMAIAAALLALGGHSPGIAFGALVRGAFGSWHNFVSVTLVQTTPLLLTGLAVGLAFKARVWNIGAEGQLHAGALAGVAVAVSLPLSSSLLLLPATLLAAAAAGALWAAVPAAMKTRMGVGEVITTLLMNFVALFLAQFLVQGPLRESRGALPQTDAIPAGAELPVLIPGFRLHLGFLIGILIAVALWLYLSRTAGGFRIRAVGASPRAAEVSGRFRTGPVIWRAFLASGAIAGMAGWIQVSGITRRMYEGLSPGWGYTAIAVALLARLHPLAAVLTAIVFGALSAGGAAMQREAGVPDAWVRGIEALVILAVLAVDRGLQAFSDRTARGETRRRAQTGTASGLA